jgi:hypothetical protein
MGRFWAAGLIPYCTSVAASKVAILNQKPRDNRSWPYERKTMPEKATVRRARADRRRGKAPTTQAGEFVREEIHHVRRGKHGARNPKQAIAIGLSKARRAGVKLGAPAKGQASERSRRQAKRDYAKGQRQPNRKPSPKRSRAVTMALKREGRRSASRPALAQQARSARRHRRRA